MADNGKDIALRAPSDLLPPVEEPDADEAEKVRIALQDFAQAYTWRNTTAAQWEEVAALIATNYVNTFYYGSYNYPGQKKTFQQVDATGMVALDRFASIMDSLLTPRNQQWHALTGGNEEIIADRACRIYLDKLTKLLFRLRYQPIANFAGQNSQNFHGLGAFGTAAMLVDQAVNEAGVPIPALRYKAIPLGELFIRENHQGLVNSFIRWFRLDAAQCHLMFKKVPGQLRSALDQQSQQKFDFLHRVGPRKNWTPGVFGGANMPFYSEYVSIQGRCLMEEGGYNEFPLAVSRYIQGPGEVYGRSPAMMVLPALKTLNAEKSTFLKQGHRAADPVLLVGDDGIIDMSLRPGAVNKGGVNADGKPLVHILQTGNIQISKEMMADEKGLINDQFLVSLFQILTESPQMTATEVIERTNEKGILIAPNAGRQMSEYLGTMIPREISLLARMGLLKQLGPMPELLRRHFGMYEVVYTSPLARAMRAQDVAGFQRTLETAVSVVNVTQDPSILDIFAFDRALPEIADIQGMPTRWTSTPDELDMKRKQRAKAQQQAAAIQAMPAQAAMMKAKAVAGKASQGNAVSQEQAIAAQGQPGLPQRPGLG